MLRVAIVGCGKIADQHVQAIRRIPASRVIAVCDSELLMARQLAERFGITGCFDDVGAMLEMESPDVVHITTPPQSHYKLGVQCLDAGSHVLIEKPFTVTADEAQRLITFAQAKGLSVVAGHNYQFTPEMLEMRRLVGEGFLGGTPVHLESYWSYDLGDLSYVGPMLGSPNHWVRRLPGQLLHNLISHGIARLAEFLDDKMEELHVSAQQSAQLQRLGGREIVDELRVLMRDGRGTTAQFCFSTQMRPGQNRFNIYGPGNSLTVDLASGSVIRQFSRSYKSYLTFLVPPFNIGLENFLNAFRNAVNIFRGRLYQDGGMKELIERFHLSISTGGEPPIPYREILHTARVMDAIFERIGIGDRGTTETELGS